jgi:hypothetical protein
VVHRTAGDAGALDDLLPADPGEPALGEQLAGSGDQRAARGGTSFLLATSSRRS